MAQKPNHISCLQWAANTYAQHPVRPLPGVLVSPEVAFLDNGGEYGSFTKTEPNLISHVAVVVAIIQTLIFMPAMTNAMYQLGKRE